MHVKLPKRSQSTQPRIGWRTKGALARRGDRPTRGRRGPRLSLSAGRSHRRAGAESIAPLPLPMQTSVTPPNRT
eukprot:gene23452-biopygen23835